MSNTLSNKCYLESMIALCNDGSLWQRNIVVTERKRDCGEWFRLNDIPQD
nr:MAG TPA: hypothetical protein [Caudoviricetes sp.]